MAGSVATGVAVVAVAEMVAPTSALTGVEGIAGPVEIDVLAAMAAAAMASGFVALPGVTDADVAAAAAGTSVNATATGIATATALNAVAATAPGGAALGSEPVAGVMPADDVPVSSAFEAPDFALVA